MAAFFGAGFSDSLESESEDDSFLAGAFLAAFFGAGLSSLESESSLLEDSSTFFFFCGTAAFSEVFLALAELLLLAEMFDEALALFVATTLTGSSDDESLDESLLDSTFFFFFSSTFLALFLLSSIDCFLDGASDEEADALVCFFYKFQKLFRHTLYIGVKI